MADEQTDDRAANGLDELAEHPAWEKHGVPIVTGDLATDIQIKRDRHRQGN